MDRTPHTFLGRLASDASGNTLAIATASIFAIMGVVGGAVDISRSYMAKSRLQQACDAGALAARKGMSGESLTTANKNEGYRYFDFNFPTGSYGVTLTSRTYWQLVNDNGTPQAIVNGTVIATVPTTIMRIFGKDTVDLTISCSSKMDIANADVAMVLDVTGSMGTDSIKISKDGTATEKRIVALRKAVRAFYNALGPGRAGGDSSKGRIRYAFVPYATTVNVGYLLDHTQMVDSWTYQSREAVSSTVHGWTEGTETGNYTAWSPATIPSAAQTAAQNPANYATFDTGEVGTGNGDYTYTKLDGNTGTMPQQISANDATDCTNKNNLIANDTRLKAVGRLVPNGTETVTESVPHWPTDTVRTSTYSGTRTVTSIGFRYRWFKVGKNTACRLESSNGNSTTTQWNQTRSKTGTSPLTWTTYTGANFVYGQRSITVSGLKGSLWNSTINVPGLNRTGTTQTYNGITLSDSIVPVDGVASGGTPQSVTVTWRGCVEERQMDNTITAGSSISSVPTAAFDLRSKLLASAGDDATRWRPWLHSVIYRPNGTSVAASDDCPTPALKLQEIGNYDSTILTSPYPNLFEAASADPDSHYFPYSSTVWSGTGTLAERSQNIATLRNYIDRIDTGAATLHDSGFIWGLHLVSGEGMFASENPDRFNGNLVSRNIVFMTDGEMNPSENGYAFSGFNTYDGRLAPAATTHNGMIAIENRRLRILCEAAKAQGITVWVVVINDDSSQDYSDLRQCASSDGNYKSAATSAELIASFTTIAESIGGLRISQ